MRSLLRAAIGLGILVFGAWLAHLALLTARHSDGALGRFARDSCGSCHAVASRPNPG